MIEESLVELLLADDAIKAIVGGPQDRVWPQAIPQNSQGDPEKVPCVVHRRVSDTQGETFCETEDLVAGVFQLDSYSRSYEQVRVLARLVKDRLKVSSGLVGGVRIHKIFVGPSFDLLDPDPGLYRVSSTFTVWYKE